MKSDYKDRIISEEETKFEKFIMYLFCTVFAGVGLLTLWVLLVFFIAAF